MTYLTVLETDEQPLAPMGPPCVTYLAVFETDEQPLTPHGAAADFDVANERVHDPLSLLGARERQALQPLLLHRQHNRHVTRYVTPGTSHQARNQVRHITQ